MVMLNDPFRGGTHLPDITLVAPVYVRRHPRAQSPDFYVASRAHHADVGGTYPGSMGLCREIYQEGLRIPPVRIMRSGAMEPDVLALLLSNVRTPSEREGDLGAQIAACHTGAERLREVCARYGLERAQSASRALLDYSERMMRAFLARVPKGTYRAEDFMDSDGISDRPVKIVVAVKVQGQRGRVARGHTVTVDFTGSDPQVEGSINAVEAITYSACFYVFRCLLEEDVPATSGLMRPIRVIAPSGTVVNARPPAAVAGGNVETSQRIVDVLLRALGAGGSGADSGGGFGNHEQSYDRGNGSRVRASRSLTTKPSRAGWALVPRSRAFRACTPSHDEFAEHAGGSAGVFVSAASTPIFSAARERGRGPAPRRRRHRARNRSFDRRRSHAAGRPALARTLGLSGAGRVCRGMHP